MLSSALGQGVKVKLCTLIIFKSLLIAGCDIGDSDATPSQQAQKDSAAQVHSLASAITVTETHATHASNLDIANHFLDAFYSWDKSRLASLIVPGADANRALYYQAWAEAGNYKIEQRHACNTVEYNHISCAVTVTDDLGGALGYVATDTFWLEISDGQVSAVEFSADDPPIFEEVFAWMARTQPEVFEGACKDMFDGGTTPKQCVRAVVAAAQDYAKLNVKQ